VQLAVVAELPSGVVKSCLFVDFSRAEERQEFLRGKERAAAAVVMVGLAFKLGRSALRFRRLCSKLLYCTVS
jgi:hypothetical protein